MNTVNAGSPNNPEEATGGIPWLALLLGVAALVFIALTGPRLVGILFAIMAPPEPPVPAGVRMLSYNRQAWGTDTWGYDTQADLCEVIAFYRDQGGVCPVLPPRCAPDSGAGQSSDFVAVCTADMEFSIFALRWRFEVPLRSAPGPRVRFDLAREIFWTGALPPQRP